jgi:predicted site-specific integrase-resolvase
MAQPTVAFSNSSPKLEPGTKRRSAKRAAIYTRVSTADQHPETQLYDLREMAKQRGYEIVHEYGDVICGAKSKRPGLDTLMADARRRRFDVVLVTAFDRVARTVRHSSMYSTNWTTLESNSSAFGRTSTLAAHLAERWLSSSELLRNSNEV